MWLESRRELVAERHNLTIAVEREFEHHMGASTVRIELSRPLLGVTTFHTTNGNAVLSEEWLVMHDTTLIIAIDLSKEDAYHLKADKPWYFTALSIVDGVLNIGLFDGSGQLREGPRIPLVEIPGAFSPGPGTKVSGRFPSAYP